MPLAAVSPFTPETPLISSVSKLTRGLLVLAVVAVTGIQAAPEKPATESKDFSLFVGFDVSFDHNSSSQLIQHVTGSNVEFNQGGKSVSVPIDAIRDYHLVQNLKLSLFRATIDNLDTKRSFSRSGDPMQKWGRAEILLTDMQARPSQGQNVGAGANPVNGAPTNIPTGPKTTGLSALEGQRENDKELFDALEVSFEISSDQPLNKAYAVVVTEYGEASKPGQLSRSVSIRALSPVTSKKQNVSVVQSGLPAGFVPGKTSVHLYSEGREFATNLSGNRIDLTRNQACEYLILQYLTANKGKTLPPSPSLMPVPKDIREHLDAAALDRPILVMVNKYGIVESAYGDSSGKKRVDPYVKSVLDLFHFAPALENGVPVPGITTIRLSDFML